MRYSLALLFLMSCGMAPKPQTFSSSLGDAVGTSPNPELPPQPPTPKETLEEKYSYVDPDHEVPTEALYNALAYYETKLQLGAIDNKNYMSVIDMSQKSNKRRYYLIDMRSGDVETLLVAHGQGSDSNNDGYATRFSNEDGTHASSLGFYMTAETYSGNNGYSLRLDGMNSTNSNARSRAIVVHGASYVDPNRTIIGRSWGCPALEPAESRRVINLIRSGSVLYIYHKDFM